MTSPCLLQPQPCPVSSTLFLHELSPGGSQSPEPHIHHLHLWQAACLDPGAGNSKDPRRLRVDDTRVTKAAEADPEPQQMSPAWRGQMLTAMFFGLEEAQTATMFSNTPTL